METKTEAKVDTPEEVKQKFEDISLEELKELNKDLLKFVEPGDKQNKKGILGILKKLSTTKIDSDLLKISLIGKTLTKLEELKAGHFKEEEGLKEEHAKEVQDLATKIKNIFKRQVVEQAAAKKAEKEFLTNLKIPFYTAEVQDLVDERTALDPDFK